MSGQGQGLEYNVDVVMLIDATGSMKPIIDEVKRNALSIYQKFNDTMEEMNKSVDKMRVKVIAFRDYACDTQPMMWSEFFDLSDSDQNRQLEDFINGIEAIGGGDEAENALEAIALALKSDWTTEGGKYRRHAILLFTDAPAHELGVRSGCASYPQGMPANLEELTSWWNGGSQTFTGTFSPAAGRFIAFAPEVEPWNKLDTWESYFPAKSKAGTGLDDIRLQEVLEVLAGSM